MRLESLVRRRPSAPLVVSFTALFVALGGVGYAAIRLPPNSVGTAQLQNGSVGNHKLKFNSVGAGKIISGAVGTKQVNATKVQLRVSSACSTGAISAVGVSGTVMCTPTLPNEFGTTGSATLLTTAPVAVASESLAAGSSYLLLAYPHAVIAGDSGDRVSVACSLSAGNTNKQISNNLVVDIGPSGDAAATIPLALPVASASSAQTALVTCDYNSTPEVGSVTVDSTLNAIQTASNS